MRAPRALLDVLAAELRRYAAVHLRKNGVSTDRGIDRARTRNRRGV